MSQWVYINEDFVNEKNADIHYNDLAIQRGYGVFDFFKVINRGPIFLEDHLNRFIRSAGEMRLTIKLSREALKDIIYTLIKINNITDCGVRLTLTGGYSPDGYQLSNPNLIIATITLPAINPHQLKDGIKLISYPHQRQLPHVKTIDYLMPIWLQPLLTKMQADDILYHQNGIITECPRSNIFIITRDDKILTPANNILHGITRMKIKTIALKMQSFEEKDISLSEIHNARAAFITSTTKIVMPVRQIDETIFEEKENKLVKHITSQLHLLINN